MIKNPRPQGDEIPEDLTGKCIPGSEYARFAVRGTDMQKIVADTWYAIWNSDLPRKYTADFEVYGEKSNHSEQAEVDIYISIR